MLNGISRLQKCSTESVVYVAMNVNENDYHLRPNANENDYHLRSPERVEMRQVIENKKENRRQQRNPTSTHRHPLVPANTDSTTQSTTLPHNQSLTDTTCDTHPDI